MASLRTLLVRGSIGTGFRAPDLSYLYAGESGSSSGGSDTTGGGATNPTPSPRRRLRPQRHGLQRCQPRQHRAQGRDQRLLHLRIRVLAGQELSFNADYYNIALTNEVLYQSSDTILREEADCRWARLGVPRNQLAVLSAGHQPGRPQFPHSDLSNPDGIIAVHVLPINAASERTSGMDLGAH